jgi:hypothetical protein
VTARAITLLSESPLGRLSAGVVNTVAGLVGTAAILGLATALAVPKVRLRLRPSFA